ncbi:MAG: phage tail tip lysozyme [Dorea sp.]|nr:phage tail tip lysozyme [Dorea sp.]
MKNKKTRVLKGCALLLVFALIFASYHKFMDRAAALDVESEAVLATETQGTEASNGDGAYTDIPVDVPTDVPGDTPADVPTDVPGDTPADTPADVPGDTPGDTPADVPGDTPADTPTDTPADVPGNNSSDNASDSANKGDSVIDQTKDENFEPTEPPKDIKDKDAIKDKKPVKVSKDDNRIIFVSKKGVAYNENETAIYDFLIDKCGFNTAAASAVLGNMYMESMLDPEAYGASENAWGLCQWENGRLVQLQNRYPNNWKTLDGQLNYLLDEFHSSALDPWGPQTYQYLLQVPDTVAGARDGALYFAKWFERCWSGSYAQRQSFAEEFYNEWIHAVTVPSIVSIAPASEDSIKCVWKRPANASRTALQIFDEKGTKLKGKTTDEETYTFTGLEMFKTYKIRIWSIAANGKYSERIDTTVKMENIPNKITLSNVTKNSLAVPWVFSLKASVNDNAKLSYKSSNDAIRVSSSGKVSIKAKFVGEAKITVTSEKTKIYAESKKTIKVKVVPPKPEGLKVTPVPITVLRATWKEVRPVSGYQIQWSKDKTFKKGVKSQTVSGKIFTYDIYGVKKNETYYVRARGYKTVNEINYCSEWTDPVKIKVTK